MNWLLIGIGGSLGAISRYAIGKYINSRNTSFPFATLIVNAIGSFLLGYIIGYNILNENLNFNFFVVAGFLGAFTTFSTFSFEIFSLLKGKETLKAFIFIFLHVFIILITGLLGFSLNN